MESVLKTETYKVYIAHSSVKDWSFDGPVNCGVMTPMKLSSLDPVRNVLCKKRADRRIGRYERTFDDESEGTVSALPSD